MEDTGTHKDKNPMKLGTAIAYRSGTERVDALILLKITGNCSAGHMIASTAFFGTF